MLVNSLEYYSYPFINSFINSFNIHPFLKVFLNQATQVNAWDRMMVNNGEKIVSLNEAVEKVKLDQQVRG